VQVTDSMPLGNGSLGAAVWAAGGFTAQLNRDDTFPDRKSPGQVTISGLSAITTAANFHAYLDLYDGVLIETGAACLFVSRSLAVTRRVFCVGPCGHEAEAAQAQQQHGPAGGQWHRGNGECA